MISSRLETLAVARAFALTRRTGAREAARPLLRFQPAALTDAAWLAAVDAAFAALRERGVIDAGHQLVDRVELARRIGAHAAKRWSQLADRILPALALGVAADDVRTHDRIANLAGWPASIAARELGLWTSGPPPTAHALCDALVWRELGLAGKPETCPAEVRAHFLRAQLRATSGSFEACVARLACAATGAPDPEALPVALVRCWLASRAIGPAPR
ncbi:MAG: hypothetical protein KF773_31145 [Deltaproteobacteria bacterium]|nr:hypothetical protein [Deltaproteobacteria bacterium]MCW5806220.1 hypothetical protein [Deltaproteobacteria bacterium]